MRVKSRSEITKTLILDEAGKLTAARPGVKAKYQNLELKPTMALPASPKLAEGSTGVQVQSVQLIQMKTPLSAVKQSAQLSGYKGDIITLYRSYQ